MATVPTKATAWPARRDSAFVLARRARVRNSECTVYLTTRNGYEQRYRREKDGWTQTGPDGTVRAMTAEQFLSHLLPALAFGRLDVRVVPDRKNASG